MDFIKSNVYSSRKEAVFVEAPDEFENRFLGLVHTELLGSEFPNLEVEVEDFKEGGGWFSDAPEATFKMLSSHQEGSSFDNFEIFYAAVPYGKLVICSVFNCMAPAGFWDVVSFKSPDKLRGEILEKCETLSQQLQFIAFDELSNIVFDRVLSQLPEVGERRATMFAG